MALIKNYPKKHLKLLILYVFLQTNPIFAQEDLKAEFTYEKVPENSQIVWKTDPNNLRPAVKVTSAKGKPDSYSVEIQGTVTNENVSLLLSQGQNSASSQNSAPNENRPIEIGSQGEFSLEINLEAPENEFSLVSIDEIGNLTTFKGRVTFIDWEKVHPSASGSQLKKKLNHYGSLGIGAINFQQKGIPSFVELNPSFRFASNYSFEKPWDLSGEINFLGPPLARGSYGISTLDIQLGGRFRLEKWLKEPWQGSLGLGLFYTTSFPSPDILGFFNLQGIRFFPSVRRVLKNGKELSGTVTYSVFWEGSSFVTLDNLLVAAELSYGPFTIRKTKQIFLFFKVDYLSINTPSGYLRMSAISSGVQTRF